MIQNAFDEIGKSDIEALISAKERESKTLEYKQELPKRTDPAKREFLADATSFANASGGDMLYGIVPEVGDDGKKTGAPLEPAPITGTSADEERLWLENVLRTGVEPRMRVQIKCIPGWEPDGEGFVVLLRIPKSFASPHMVKDTSRFYSRNSAGKYPLDVHEIRSAFLATESQAERVKRFRQDRLAQIVADETPVPLAAPARLVLHIIPLTPFLNDERLDLSDIEALSPTFRPVGSSGWDHGYNIDGLLTYTRPLGPGRRAYCQLFFNGAVEAVSASLRDDSGGTCSLGSKAYETHVMEAVGSYLDGLRLLGVTPPVAVSLSLLGFKGWRLAVGDRYLSQDPHPIDRDALVIRGVMADDLQVDAAKLMRPIFDAVWNACGYARCYNYDKQGNRLC